ncbi:MAG TPA: cache domain-containing protein [bacterium]|nr:cache domain-containing protein [bacterium]
MIFTSLEIKNSIHTLTETNSLNNINLIKLNIENEYKSILFQKEYALNRYKEQLKNVTNLTVQHINSFWELYKKGKYSESTAKQLAAESLRNFRYGNNDYFFVYDLNLVNVSHPDNNIYKHNLENYQDVKGNFVIREMKKLAINSDTGYLSFWYIKLGDTEPAEKLSYIVSYKNWGWIVGTGVYIDDVKKDYDKRLKSVMEELKETFSNLKIGKNGYFFLFDEAKNLLIHPYNQGKNFSEFINPVSGENHINELIKAAETNGKPYIYFWDKPEQQGKFEYLKKSYVTKFKPLNWYIASSIYQDELDEPIKKILYKQIVIALIIISVSSLLSILLAGRVTRSLNILTKYAKQLSYSEFKALTEIETGITELLKKIGMKDEIGKLSNAFSFMINSLKTHIEKLKKTTAANERIKSELKIAAEIQSAMLPNPQNLITNEFEVSAKIIPAAEIGGDLFDFFFLDKTNFFFLVGDVSDKGIPAALFMSKTKTALRLVVSDIFKYDNQISPSKILNNLNCELVRNNEMKMFVTMFLAVYNLQTHKLSYANAGHNLPLLISDKIKFFQKTKGIPLGIKSTYQYVEDEIEINKGDTILLYTDGITESINKTEKLFGDTKLIETIEKYELKNNSLKSLIDYIIKSVNQYSAECSQSDDITVLAFKTN